MLCPQISEYEGHQRKIDALEEEVKFLLHRCTNFSTGTLTPLEDPSALSDVSSCATPSELATSEIAPSWLNGASPASESIDSSSDEGRELADLRRLFLRSQLPVGAQYP